MPAALAALAASLIAASAWAGEVYAHVEFLSGSVTIVSAGGTKRPARLDEEILEGETIVTGPGGELHARTADHGLIALRARSELKIDSFAAHGDDGDHSVVTLLRGTFRSITGWIGKYQRRAYLVKTPTATIGVRGTDHEPLVQAIDAPGFPAGTYDKVNTGATYIETARGRADIEPGRAGFAPARSGEPPRVLDRVPDAYKRSPNEHLIDRKREELAREVEQARAEAQARARQQPGAEPRSSSQGGESVGGAKAGKAEPGEEAKSQAEAHDESLKDRDRRRHRRNHKPD